MKAVIMAGGEGKRLRPITCTMPKPMVPLLNKPVIDYCIELLKRHGITDVTATLHYLPNEIMQHCGGGERYGVKLSYSIEDKPLGTAGSVRQACNGGRVLVISGDAMTDLDISAALHSHEKSGAKVTIVLKKVEAPTEYGVALMHNDGRIYRFLEKPMLSEVFSDLANTGIYILEPDVLELIPQNEKFDFSCDLFPLLLKNGMPIYGYVTDSYWCDIGDIEQYRAAQRDMLNGRCNFSTAATEREGVWIEEGAHISESAELIAPCYIASGAEIGENVTVSEHSVMGRGARLGANSSAKRTVVMENARVRENVQLRGAILCPQSEVESGASIFDGSVIGGGAAVGKNCTVSNAASLWPQRRIGDGEKCLQHVKWEENSQRPLCAGRVCEYTDTRITPERAARVGAAYAVSLGRLPGEVAVATDGSQQAVMLKHALISGIASQGADIADMGFCGYSAFEYGIREFSCAGGVYIRGGAYEHHLSEIIMCDGAGSELSGARFRAFAQELAAGPHLPVTSERLGIVQRVTGASRAYEAHLARMLNSTRSADNGVSILIGGSPEIYDMAARVLMPAGFRVRYYTGLDMAALYGAMVHERADAAFVADYLNGVTEAMVGEERIGADRLSVILALAALDDLRTKKLIMPADMANEYIRLLTESGGEVAIGSSSRPQRMRASLEGGAYLPELFEPEARIIRTAELVRAGRLREYASRLPRVELAEKNVGCSWRDVGRVLRSLVDTEKYENVELVDGVKVRVDDGWVLVRPNSGFTACRIIAGSFDAEYSQELADVYRKKIQSIAEEKERK